MVISRFLIRFLISMEEMSLLIIRKIYKLWFGSYIYSIYLPAVLRPQA